MRVEELTGREILDVEKALGTSFSEAADSGNMMVGFALYWVARRRDNPDYTYSDALNETIETVTEAIGDLNDETPKASVDSGEASPGSAASGA